MNEQQLLASALDEIRTLREQNKFMAARLDVFDNMLRVFHTVPNYGNSGAMHPDIAWEINKHLENLKKEENVRN